MKFEDLKELGTEPAVKVFPYFVHVLYLKSSAHYIILDTRRQLIYSILNFKVFMNRRNFPFSGERKTKNLENVVSKLESRKWKIGERKKEK